MTVPRYDQKKLVTAIEMLTQRKKNLREILRTHELGQCSCSDVRRWLCTSTQRRFRATIRAHNTAHKDLMQWVIDND